MFHQLDRMMKLYTRHIVLSWPFFNLFARVLSHCTMNGPLCGQQNSINRLIFVQDFRVMKLCQWHIILTLTFFWHFLNAHFVPWKQVDSIKVTYLKIMEGSISNMLEEGSNNRGISLFKLVKGLLLLLTYKTSHDVSWKTYEADVKDQSILFNHQA